MIGLIISSVWYSLVLLAVLIILGVVFRPFLIMYSNILQPKRFVIAWVVLTIAMFISMLIVSFI